VNLRVRKSLQCLALGVALAGWLHAGVPALEPIPDELPQEVRAALARRQAELRQELSDLVKRNKAFAAKYGGGVVEGSPEEAAARRELAALEAAKTKYVEAARQFNQDVEGEGAKWREQHELTTSAGPWLRKQEAAVREAAGRHKEWRQEVVAAIEEGREPAPAHRPKELKDLLPGDILLFTPDTSSAGSKALPAADRFYRVLDDLCKGNVFRALSREKSPAAHALTFVKEANGRLLFLDHTPKVGSRILDEKQLVKQYQGRGIYVARPQAPVDGKKLWGVAREAALQKKPGFGLLGDKAVCSEKAAIAVATATGLKLEGNRLGPIDITPGDFFDTSGVGKYFLVSPLGK